MAKMSTSCESKCQIEPLHLVVSSHRWLQCGVIGQANKGYLQGGDVLEESCVKMLKKVSVSERLSISTKLTKLGVDRFYRFHHVTQAIQQSSASQGQEISAAIPPAAVASFLWSVNELNCSRLNLNLSRR